MRPTEILKAVALAICLVGIFVCVRFLVLLPDRLDPQGTSNSICAVAPLASVENGGGMEVTAHLTVCSGGFVHDSATYIYLHKKGEQETPERLVFRFSNDPYAGPPIVKWADPSHVTVSVDSVELVTKIVPSHQGVEIAYLIGREKGDRAQVQHELVGLKRTAIGSGVVALVLLVLAGWLGFSIRRDWRTRTGNPGSARN